jgi:1-acyl-sn-glycerol-3-phosphate acyltransferase
MTEDLARMREQVYKDPRPKEHFDKFHERVRARRPNWVYEVVRMVTTLWGWIGFRATCVDADHVPSSGPVIIAPNHFSFMDHFLTGMFIRRRVQFMAKSQLFTKPMEHIYSPGGVFPVRRGYRDEEAFISAETILGRGGPIVMYCEGGRSRSGKLSETAKPGIGRLVLETGAPVVPVAIVGSSHIRNWKKLRFPKVWVQYGEPISWERVENPTREQQQAVADQVLDEIRTLYEGLREHGRKGVAARLKAKRAAERRSGHAATA